jgi:competence protein ComEC
VTLIVLGLAWVAGLVAVGAFHAPWWMGAAWILMLAPVLALLPGRRTASLWVASVLSAACAGWLLAGSDEHAEPQWLALADEEIRLTGTVASEPDIGSTTAGYVINVDSIGSGSGRSHEGGRVLVYVNQYSRYLPGDRLVVEGKLELPPTFDTFDYRAYLARRGIAATMFRPRVVTVDEGGWSPGRGLAQARLSLDRSLRRSLPEPEASLAAGIAFGREDGLSRQTLEHYNRAGLRHLVAVSGSNVILVAAIAEYVAVRTLGRRRAWLPAALFVALYLAAAGLSPSVLRSGLMAGVLLTGGAIGRPQSGLPALAAAVIGMTAISPTVALDTGFQLSTTATAGLIAFSPWLSEAVLRATRWRWFAAPRWLCDTTAMTLSASVATLPVMWATFGEVSLVSPVANVVAAPAFVGAFVLSIVAAGAGLLSRDAGDFVALAAYYPLGLIGWTANAFGSWRFASVAIGRSGTEVAIAGYVVLAALAAAAYRFRPSPAESHSVSIKRSGSHRAVLAGMFGAVAVAVVPISCAPRGGPGALVVDFLDVGQGDAALLTTPHGHQVLIDGGPSGIELAREIGAVMPHWDRTLDAVVLSHPQEDHAGGLPEVLDRFRVARVYDDGASNATLTVAEYERRARKRTALAAGDEFEVDGVRFEVLWPPRSFTSENLNDLSLVVRVTYRETAILFTGDAEMPALEQVLAAGTVHADVLKVPHHGSKTTGADFFRDVSPAVAVISVGSANIFGHPHPDTLAALDDVQLFRTDTNGRVRVRVDETRISVLTER